MDRETILIALKVAVAELNARGYVCAVVDGKNEPGIRPLHAFPPAEVMLHAIAAGWCAAGVPEHRMVCSKHILLTNGALLCAQPSAQDLLKEPRLVCPNP